MSLAKATAVIVLASILAAAVVALVSRAPASLRSDRAAPDRTDASHGASFSDAEVERHASYRRVGITAFALAFVLEIGVLLVLASGPVRALVESLTQKGWRWPLIVACAAALMVVVLSAAGFALSFVRGFVVEHAWGQSTQSALGFVSDWLKGVGVGVVIACITAVAFVAVVRWQPRWWWVWGWAFFTLLTALLVFLWPVVIAPLFNKFTPLEDAALERRARALAQEAGVTVDEVLVADASRRTVAENAYVAGLGTTKQLVLFDTLVRSADEDQAAFVIAHELGHQVEGHVPKNVAVASLSLLLGFGTLALLAGYEPLWRWAGAESIADPRALPMLAALVALGTLLALPAQNLVSRSFERRADEIALQLTDDPNAAVESFRRLAYANLADLRPPRPIVWLLYSHPPIVERIQSAIAVRSGSP